MTPTERALLRRIATEGRLTFAAFMELALYDPVHGYYARRPLPFGAGGDYYTSSEVHPAFAALLGRQVVELWDALDRPVPFIVHEAGPGSGIFARDLLNWLAVDRPALYAALRYRLDEVSIALRAQQRQALTTAGHAGRVTWVRGFGARPSAHLIFANELLDALPVHLVRTERGRLEELYVQAGDDGLRLAPGPPSSPALTDYFDQLGLRPGEGCRAEVNLAAVRWVAAAAAALERGLLMIMDYGYPAETLYAPTRRRGSLLCYHQHTLSSNPLARVGEQDITSHVDFTSARAAGEATGMRTLGLVPQRRLLQQLGWSGLRAALAEMTLSATDLAANLRALDALVDPSGLGRVLGLLQQRDLDDFRPLGLVGGAPMEWKTVPLRGPQHLFLPGPVEAERFPDIEAQWAELWSRDDDGAQLTS